MKRNYTAKIPRYILYDIGGTKIRFAVSYDSKSFTNYKVIPTPSDFNQGVKVFKDTVKEFSQGAKIKAIAGGIAGVLDKNKTKLIKSPHLKNWTNKPFKKILEKSLNTAVFLGNDTDIGGLGETAFGAGRNFKIVVYLTVSTGVGGTRIVNGRIDKNVMGFEPGHQIINAGGWLCPNCQTPGHLEGYISGSAIEKRYHKKPWKIKDPRIWNKIASYLAIGLNNTIVYWSPEIIVLGGAMVKNIPLNIVKGELKRILSIFPKIPFIKKSQLKDSVGLYGALEYLRQKYNKQ